MIRLRCRVRPACLELGDRFLHAGLTRDRPDRYRTSRSGLFHTVDTTGRRRCRLRNIVPGSALRRCRCCCRCRWRWRARRVKPLTRLPRRRRFHFSFYSRGRGIRLYSFTKRDDRLKGLRGRCFPNLGDAFSCWHRLYSGVDSVLSISCQSITRGNIPVWPVYAPAGNGWLRRRRPCRVIPV